MWIRGKWTFRDLWLVWAFIMGLIMKRGPRMTIVKPMGKSRQRVGE
jgi:hypothetical protein